MIHPIMAFDPRIVIGPMQVGSLLSAVFYGCLVSQIYLYFKLFPTDPRGFKIFVIALGIWQLGHFICLVATLWSMTVIAYDHPSILDTLPLGTKIILLLSSFTCSTVQAFYTIRLWKISNIVILPLVSGMLGITAQVAAFIFVVRAFNMANLETFGKDQHFIITFAAISRSASDIFTTIGIAATTLKKRSLYVSGATATTRLADRVIAWMLETCLVASLLTFSIAVLLLTLPNNSWFGLYLINANLIANSLLAWLNRRFMFMREMDLTVCSTINFAE
ncbi:uncharacterized protein EDB93DRAFT_276009 [Suillus bovinus]|uniref:uncharacterized protein n=1 Tax=Suillus bovinus TaxID=48563 RepID=UPI001B86D539|nr:uncharacterized protein EDB93DRAFT_276009 [Suillus bovinus]KAG2159255.1 hypothetical protein EDB93DRAFT_276009 [Suillus bovinus]